MDRISPWYSADEEVKTAVPIPPYMETLISNLTPSRRHVRLGFLINGKESSITVPFELAIQFMEQVRTLILEKGVRSDG